MTRIYLLGSLMYSFGRLTTFRPAFKEFASQSVGEWSFQLYQVKDSNSFAAIIDSFIAKLSFTKLLPHFVVSVWAWTLCAFYVCVQRILQVYYPVDYELVLQHCTCSLHMVKPMALKIHRILQNQHCSNTSVFVRITECRSLCHDCCVAQALRLASSIQKEPTRLYYHRGPKQIATYPRGV